MGRRYEGPETLNEAMRFLDGRDSRVWNGLRATRLHLVEGWQGSKRRYDNEFTQKEGVKGVALEYQWTDVVTWFEDGDIIINSGGWHTNTTKHRLGAVTQVWQNDGDWFFEHGGVTYNFENGAILHPNGTVSGATPTILSDWNDKFGEELETVTQLVERIQGFDLETTQKVWKKLRKHHRFIAVHCIDEFIPTILGVEDVRDIVSERMRRVA